MKLEIYRNMLLRTPKYPANSRLGEIWELLKDDIRHASPEFYEYIKNYHTNQLADLPEKTKYTIWKYLNRSKYRCIPFGSFAAISISPTKWSYDGSSLYISKNMKLKTFRDWSSQSNPKMTLAALEKYDLTLFSNSSFYRVKNKIRFLAFEDEKFELGEVETSEAIELILSYCAKKITYQALKNTASVSGFDLVNFPPLILDLIDAQLIFTEYHRNIIGEDYFSRVPINENGKRYILATRDISDVSFHKKQANGMLEMIEHLHQIAPIMKIDYFEKFISAFIAKFSQAEIPLLHALDPEIGVGYAGLESLPESQVLTEQLKAPKKSKLSDHLHAQLKIMVMSTTTETTTNYIHVDQIPILKNHQPLPLPNTFTLLFNLKGQQVIINALGGCTANSISGRFSLAGSEFLQYNSSIADLEGNANPEVLFFDIGYTSEIAVDNINRRKQIYPLTLNILNFDTSSDPLLINDLLVSVRNNEIILRSKSLNKRLVPRMSSAYNYQRSNLALFRFLCDLQHQGIQTVLLPELEILLPDLDFYPRLQFKDIVLSPRKWKLKWSESYKDIEILLNNFQMRGIPTLLEAGHGDQYLTFNLKNAEECRYFQLFCQQYKQLIVRESFDEKDSVAKDEDGNAYRSQWQLAVTHKSEIYRSVGSGSQVDPSIPPGNDWLYYKIYCHEQRCDQLLLEIIRPFILINKTVLRTWFFIRYSDSGNHIRLRIQLGHPCYSAELVSQFSRLLKADLEAGIVSDFSIQTYVPEIARYGDQLISKVEKHFCLDSKFVIELIPRELLIEEKYQIVHFLIETVSIEILSSRKPLGVIEKICQNFEVEHQLGPDEFKILNSNFKSFSKLPPFKLSQKIRRFSNQICKSLVEVIALAEPDKKVSLFADLIHMHVNRLFTTDHRTHEMICYYYLVRKWRSELQNGGKHNSQPKKE